MFLFYRTKARVLEFQRIAQNQTWMIYFTFNNNFSTQVFNLSSQHHFLTAVNLFSNKLFNDLHVALNQTSTINFTFKNNFSTLDFNFSFQRHFQKAVKKFFNNFFNDLRLMNYICIFSTTHYINYHSMNTKT